MTQLEQIRKEYEDRGIDASELDDNPFSEFQLWLDRAIENSPGPWFEANAMTLSTSDSSGIVTSRTVLLKQNNRKGFVFFTNYDSEKGKQIEENADVALLFHWHYLGQQVRIRGKASKTDRAISETYFHSRPRGSQLSAAVSSQSEVIKSRSDLENKVTELKREIGDGQVPLPDTWGGYLVEPVEFEFWQGRTNRLHDRIRYRMDSNSWLKERLAP